MRIILSLVVVMAVVILALVYLNGHSISAPKNLNDATKTERCAKFRQVDEEDNGVYSLGYGGRIRQLIHGCF